MSLLMDRVKQLAVGFDEETLRSIEINPLLVEAGAVQAVAPYLKEQRYSRVIVAADAITYDIAGKKLEEAIAALGISVHVTLIKPDRQGDVIADEASIVQLLLDIQQ